MERWAGLRGGGHGQRDVLLAVGIDAARRWGGGRMGGGWRGCGRGWTGCDRGVAGVWWGCDRGVAGVLGKADLAVALRPHLPRNEGIFGQSCPGVDWSGGGAKNALLVRIERDAGC